MFSEKSLVNFGPVTTEI